MHSPKATRVSVILHPCRNLCTHHWSSISTRPCLHHRSLSQRWPSSCMTCSSPAPVAYTLTVWRRGHESEKETWLKRRSQTSKYPTHLEKMRHRVIMRWSCDRVSCSPTAPNLLLEKVSQCRAQLQDYSPLWAQSSDFLFNCDAKDFRETSTSSEFRHNAIHRLPF